ncbi:uncharacterized protein LOC105781481 [Gossypium raimondii]|uniref:uncharacterized protein LOC105781481 n=1 Tax=Gossypium raimondii TaxID=29730 RepID=UPI00063AC6A0|nr:uncharacterized protein LOC105781481 [Gossypium raimondii]
MAECWYASLPCTPEQKLKGTISLLHDEGKYVGVSYVNGHRREFMNLTQEDRTVAKYETQFLRLSCYVRGMVALEYKKCVRFEDGLKNNLRVLIALQREREFVVLVNKAKITEEVKHVERQNQDQERGKNKRDLEPSNSTQRPKK